MLEKLVEMSNRYGNMEGYVLAGGGNTSYKEGGVLYVKGSGVSLAEIKEGGFVAMDRKKLSAMLEKTYPAGDSKREAAALADLMDARVNASGNTRPSVETPLHNLFPYTYVLHLHPTLVSGLLCAKNGAREAREMFGTDFLWVGICRPGYELCKRCATEMAKYEEATGAVPKILLLQNHGVFVAADTVEEIDLMMKCIMDKLSERVVRWPDLSEVPYDVDAVNELKSKIQGLYSTNVLVDFAVNKEVLDMVKNPASFAPIRGAFTPDHIVYCKAKFLYAENADELSQVFELFVRDNGYLPKIICMEKAGAFVVGAVETDVKNARLLFLDAVSVAVLAESFGGYLHMTQDLVDFILNWESESYRQKVAEQG